jgi:hypothetical protein
MLAFLDAKQTRGKRKLWKRDGRYVLDEGISTAMI